MQTDLFQPLGSVQPSILPKDGVASYHPSAITKADADRLFERLSVEIPWRHDELVIFGRKITTRRMTSWHGDLPYAYTYSHQTRAALPLTRDLREIKDIAEDFAGTSFNSCLLNLYHDGTEGMGWHSDDEDTLVAEAPIASVSLGAVRNFQFRHKADKTKASCVLGHGSLLVMFSPVQRHWQHSLPVSKKILSPRINLTFRVMKAETVWNP